MDILKAETEKKRKALASASKGLSSKYIKRADLNKIDIENYHKNQVETERLRKLRLLSVNPASETLSTGINVNDTLNTSMTLELPAVSTLSDVETTQKMTKAAQDTKDDNDNEQLINLDEDEIIRRLRARDQPIRLFGESNQQRLGRLRKVESTEECTNGQRNDFKDLLQAADKGLAETLLRGKGNQEADAQFEKKKAKNPFKDIDTSIISLELLQADRDTTCNLIAVYIKRLLLEWAKELQSRPDEQRRTTQGKLQAATMAQAGEYLKPFFRGLKKRDLAEDILARVTEICYYTQQREYQQANDAYLRLSIGNAPWPIGVTMVGIHERSGREKIFSSQIAHALNDETQRKWIQSIKRLMTFAQTKWPPEDLSKLVG
ncbi:hypothetical protein BDV3_002673 [Batrachochytrium dendrobatidis]|nr:Prp18 domain-containing protein [Batrachochytrium dendrobatidis JEL423]